MRSTPSVVQVHNQRVTLTVPTSAAAGNWDATIWYTGFNYTDFNMGLGQVATSAVATVGHAYDHAALTAGYPFGSLVYQSGPAGTAIDLGVVNAGDTRGALASARTHCNHRLIGVAVEVANTTAEMYKQGSTTVAMLPDVDYDRGVIDYIDTNAAPWGMKSYPSMRAACPASTVAILQNVPTASTWPAARGVYAIPRLQNLEPPIYDVYAAHHAVSYFGPTQVCSRVTGTMPAVGGVVFPHIAGGQLSGFSPLQVFFTGLSNSSSLTVTFRTIVEYFPPITTAMGAAASDLLPFVTPSPSYDPKALALYSATVAKAPYAVPVDMNSAGEYFKMVLKAISSAAPLLGTMFAASNPTIGLAMKAIGGAAGVASSMIRIKKTQAGAGAMPVKTPRAKVSPLANFGRKKKV